MHMRSRWTGLFVSLVAVTACSDPSTSTPLSYDEVAIAEEAETLKGDFIEKGGACPEGWYVYAVNPGDKVDYNLNGYVCIDGIGGVVDDELVSEGPETEFAGGHGNFQARGKTRTQNISFSFHGRQNKSMIVKGQFEFHDPNNTLRVHGEVNCLVVTKNRAILGGLVMQSTDPQLPVGGSVIWTTMDNGEGINEPVDYVSRPMRVKSPKEGCKGNVLVPIENLIESGNIQVLR